MPVTRRRTPLAVRFWARVDVSAGSDACWPWMGARDPNGYGRIGKPGREGTMLASRLSLQLAGIDVAGWNVLHACDNPPCVNPTHLRVGSQLDNMRDAGIAKLTAEDVTRIRESTLSNRALGVIFACNPSTISRVRHGLRWRTPCQS
jgi:hypothetical protein